MYRLIGKSRKERGFTLIELLVVVAIIGILAAIALPKLFSAICKAKEGNAAGVMGSVNGALSMYFADLEGRYPSATSANLTSMAYFHPKYMNVPLDPWGGNYKYAGNSEAYSVQVQLGTSGCDGTGATNDDYQYYSSGLGVMKKTSAAVI